jgi:hypothetical protein
VSRIETIGDFRIFYYRERIVFYALCPRGTATAVYIGSTSQPLRRRIEAHVRDARKGSALPVHAWMRAHASFDVRVLGYSDSAIRCEVEQKLVDEHKPPLNVTDGGPGLSGHKFAGTDHARRINAALRSGAHFDCRRCGTRFWRKRSEIVKGNNLYCSRVCSNTRHKEASLGA